MGWTFELSNELSSELYTVRVGPYFNMKFSGK